MDNKTYIQSKAKSIKKWLSKGCSFETIEENLKQEFGASGDIFVFMRDNKEFFTDMRFKRGTTC